MLYSLCRRVLFSMQPETAHNVTMANLDWATHLGLHKLLTHMPDEDPVEVMGLRFPNTIGLAAGMDKDGIRVNAFGALGFGHVEIGTITPLAQPGNPKPRCFRVIPAKGIINRFGFNNDGLDAFIANVKKSTVRAQGKPLLLGLNIGKNAVTPIEEATNDYLICLEGVYPHADYVTVNISSPNTKNLRALQSDEALDGLLGAIATKREELAAAQGRRVPIFVKIAPDLDENQVKVIAATLQRHGMDGVIATNTTLSRDAVKGMEHGEEAGGLSGAPAFEASNRVISQLRAALGKGFPIVGVGGIMSAQDAVAKIHAGADVVQIYSGLVYAGPALVTEAAKAIKAMRP